MIHTEPNEILRVLLDEDSFYLVPLSNERIEFHLDLEIHISNALQQADTEVYVIDSWRHARNDK